jgi:CheY-like chemotaxis protein
MAELLIVDDNLDAAKPLARLLRLGGHNAECIDSGERALAHLQHHRPSLLLLDVMMPGMDGMEVLRRVRTDARLRDLPVVMFSAISDDSYRAEALRKGAQDYIVKANLDFQALLRRIEQNLETLQ